MSLTLNSTLDELWDASSAAGACQEGLDDSAKWKGQGNTIADYIALSTADETYNVKYNVWMLGSGVRGVLDLANPVLKQLAKSVILRGQPMLVVRVIVDNWSLFDAAEKAWIKSKLAPHRMRLIERLEP